MTLITIELICAINLLIIINPITSLSSLFKWLLTELWTNLMIITNTQQLFTLYPPFSSWFFVIAAFGQMVKVAYCVSWPINWPRFRLFLSFFLFHSPAHSLQAVSFGIGNWVCLSPISVGHIHIHIHNHSQYIPMHSSTFCLFVRYLLPLIVIR